MACVLTEMGHFSDPVRRREDSAADSNSIYFVGRTEGAKDMLSTRFCRLRAQHVLIYALAATRYRLYMGTHGAMRTERVTGFWDAVRHVWRAEGLRGLWKGAGTTLYGSSFTHPMPRSHERFFFRVIAVPSATSYMLTYDYLLRVVVPEVSPSPTVTPLIAGALARGVISSVASPLELIRTNLQSTPPSPDNPHTLRSVLTSIRALSRSQGFGSLWRGLGPTLWRDVPFKWDLLGELREPQAFARASGWQRRSCSFRQRGY